MYSKILRPTILRNFGAKLSPIFGNNSRKQRFRNSEEMFPNFGNNLRKYVIGNSETKITE